MCGPWRCFLGSSLGVEKCFQHVFPHAIFPAQSFSVGTARAQAEAVGTRTASTVIGKDVQTRLVSPGCASGDGWMGW
jgi:hypothetical protein